MVGNQTQSNRITVRCIIFALSFASLLGWGFFYPSESNAESCDVPVDLRKTTVAGLPSGEQGDSYACGFFAASTLLDSFRMQNDGKLDSLPIDPIGLGIDLAIQVNRPRWLPIQVTTDPLSDVGGRRGSYFCDIIDHVRDNAVCDFNDPRAQNRAWMTTRSNQGMALYKALSTFAAASTESQKKKLPALVLKVRELTKNETTVPQSDEALTKLLWQNRDTPYPAVRALLYPQCKASRTGKAFERLPDCQTQWFAGLGSIGIGQDTRKAQRITQSIHEGLNTPNGLPIPVLHCFQVFREGRAFESSTPFSSSCIMHYTNVIGRRKKNGVCQFLIRNSYDPKTGGDVISKDWERDGADFWVDAPIFSRSAYALHWLED